MTWPRNRRHQNTSLQSTKHHHHGTAEGSFTAKKWFGHRAGRSPCAHSIGKFFLWLIVFFFETSAPGLSGHYWNMAILDIHVSFWECTQFIPCKLEVCIRVLCFFLDFGYKWGFWCLLLQRRSWWSQGGTSISTFKTEKWRWIKNANSQGSIIWFGGISTKELLVFPHIHHPQTFSNKPNTIFFPSGATSLTSPLQTLLASTVHEKVVSVFSVQNKEALINQVITSCVQHLQRKWTLGTLGRLRTMILWQVPRFDFTVHLHISKNLNDEANTSDSDLFAAEVLATQSFGSVQFPEWRFQEEASYQSQSNDF